MSKHSTFWIAIIIKKHYNSRKKINLPQFQALIIVHSVSKWRFIRRDQRNKNAYVIGWALIRPYVLSPDIMCLWAEGIFSGTLVPYWSKHWLAFLPRIDRFVFRIRIGLLPFYSLSSFLSRNHAFFSSGKFYLVCFLCHLYSQCHSVFVRLLLVCGLFLSY